MQKEHGMTMEKMNDIIEIAGRNWINIVLALTWV